MQSFHIKTLFCPFLNNVIHHVKKEMIGVIAGIPEVH